MESLISQAEEAPTTEAPAPEAEAQTTETKLFADKYKSVEDLETGYKELYKSFTEKRPQAPEKYEFDYSNNADLKSIAEMVDFNQDPLVQSMTAKFKSHNIPQEVATELVGEYLAFQKSMLPDPGEEIKKLGRDADNLLKTARLAVNGLSPEATETAMALTSTADGVKLLNELVAKYREKGIPSGQDEVKSAPQQSSADLYARAREIKRSADLTKDRKAESEYNDIYARAMELEKKGL